MNAIGPRHVTGERASRPGLPSAPAHEPGKSARRGSTPPLRLVAALPALQRTVGNAAVARLLARSPEPGSTAVPSAPGAPPVPVRRSFPWLGEIHGAWSAALRAEPLKDPGEPHAGTVADLPRGTEVRVVGAKGGWLGVEVTLGGTELRGYVSHELVRYTRASTFELPEITVQVRVPTVSEAFVELKRAERDRAEGGADLVLTGDRKDRIDLAISVLRSTKKYEVDETTFRVSFSRPAGTKTQVSTIEDFILFVEEVERTYPSAPPAAVASEIRQMWFSDPNWELLVASQGIREGGRMVDIETEAPLATSFDMKQIAPRAGSLQLDTPMGKVDVGHVMAGIDAALSGMPPQYPEDFLEEREDITGGDHDTYKNAAAYKALRAASGGDVRDFTTWSGDLGQAYAEYLVDRHLVGNTSATLAGWLAVKAPPEELRGDIHGYIAIEVWKSVPKSTSPSGGELKISNVLRDMYLVRKTSPSPYATFFERVSGKAAADQQAYITERSLAFAKTWYAKRAYEEKGTGAWTPTGVLEEKDKEFDAKHALNESTAAPPDRIGAAVADFVGDLAGTVE